MAEARCLKSGRWRIYDGPGLNIARDETGATPTFDSLEVARDWWAGRHPADPPLQEAIKCARCGAYFGPAAEWTLYAGRYYHTAHTPQAVVLERRRL